MRNPAFVKSTAWIEAKKGREAAERDLNEGWFDGTIPFDDDALRKHLKASIGASDDYCDAYISTLRKGTK